MVSTSTPPNMHLDNVKVDSYVDPDVRRDSHGNPNVRGGLTLVASGKNAVCIGGQCKECSLHWWPVGRMPITLVDNKKNAPYIGGQWEECRLH